MSRFQHAIVVGASSGLGAEIVRQLAADGCRVAALARRQELLDRLAAGSPDRVFPFRHDVKDVGEVAELFQQAARKLGGLDLLVYAAGVMPAAAEDEFDLEKDLAMIETNFAGAAAWINEAAARFYSTGHGSIAAIGSVAGDRGRARRPMYCATKAALATFMEAIRNRLHRRGVTVSTIKPGPIDTAMVAGLGFKNPMPVTDAARLCIRLFARPGDHYLKPTHRVVFAVIRLMPGFLMRKMKI